jgi:hypothetical protein
VNSRYYLTFKSTFQSEKPKKLEKTSLNDKFFDWDYLHLTALMKETYFSNANASRECNFAMGIILGKVFPQALWHSCYELYALVLVENPLP